MGLLLCRETFRLYGPPSPDIGSETENRCLLVLGEPALVGTLAVLVCQAERLVEVVVDLCRVPLVSEQADPAVHVLSDLQAVTLEVAGSVLARAVRRQREPVDVIPELRTMPVPAPESVVTEEPLLGPPRDAGDIEIHGHVVVMRPGTGSDACVVRRLDDLDSATESSFGDIVQSVQVSDVSDGAVNGLPVDRLAMPPRPRLAAGRMVDPVELLARLGIDDWHVSPPSR